MAVSFQFIICLLEFRNLNQKKKKSYIKKKSWLLELNVGHVAIDIPVTSARNVSLLNATHLECFYLRRNDGLELTRIIVKFYVVAGDNLMGIDSSKRAGMASWTATAVTAMKRNRSDVIVNLIVIRSDRLLTASKPANKSSREEALFFGGAIEWKVLTMEIFLDCWMNGADSLGRHIRLGRSGFTGAESNSESSEQQQRDEPNWARQRSEQPGRLQFTGAAPAGTTGQEEHPTGPGITAQTIPEVSFHFSSSS